MKPRARSPLICARDALPALGALLLIGFLSWPMLFTSSALGGDWVNHLWELRQQSLSIRHNFLPSLFIQSSSVFVPLFAFYGGTLYAVAGVLSIALGSVAVAYVGMFVLGFAAAYAGWYWLGRRFGLGPWMANVPGFVFVTSGYYLTLIYARGDWPEFMAVSMIPLMVASALSVLGADRLRAGPALALALSTTLFFGSHNITMLWGVTLLVVFGATLMLAVPRSRVILSGRALTRTAIVIVPAALVNAWYLIPALAYGFKTGTANGFGRGLKYTLITSQHLVAADHLFALSHAWASDSGFVTALPVLAAAWVVIGMGLSLRGGTDPEWRRVLLILVGLTVAVGILMTHLSLLETLPRAYETLQFGYRLDSFVTSGLAGAMLAALVAIRPSTRIRTLWLGALIAVCIASAAGAAQEVDSYPHNAATRSAAFQQSAPSYYFLGLLLWYGDATLPVIDTSGLPAVAFPARLARTNHVSIRVTLPPDTRLIDTNVAATPPALLDLTGARVVGRDPGQNLVLALPVATGSQHVITLRESESLPVVLGLGLTLAALAFWVLAALLRWARGSRSAGSAVLLGFAIVPAAFVSVGLLVRPLPSSAPTAVAPTALPTRLPALEACLSRRGFVPHAALRVAASGYVRIDAQFANGRDLHIFAFASPSQARERASGLLRLGGVRRGRMVVLSQSRDQPPSPQELSRLQACLPSA